jgi:hypothetical protein
VNLRGIATTALVALIVVVAVNKYAPAGMKRGA